MEQYPSDNFIPQREPNEVTLEYVAEPKPYVAYYVQDRPLPGRKPETAAQEPPAKTRRKGHRGLKIFLICLAAVLVLAGGLYAAWWFGLLPDRFYGGDQAGHAEHPKRVAVSWNGIQHELMCSHNGKRVFANLCWPFPGDQPGNAHHKIQSAHAADKIQYRRAQNSIIKAISQ